MTVRSEAVPARLACCDGWHRRSGGDGSVRAAARRHAADRQGAPVNSGANPYRVIRDWAQLTLEKRPWGGSNGVAIDRDGKTVWATDRCSPGTTPGCLGTKANPVHHFDESGKEIRSFGGGMFVWPHGIHVDRDGNVWVTDARAAARRRAQQVSRRRQQGQRRRQVQSRRQGADDARQAGRAGEIRRTR